MQKYLLGGLALVLALTLGMVGSAGAASTFTESGHDQGIDFAVEKNGKQLTTRSGPLAISGEDYTCNGQFFPPAACDPPDGPLTQPDKAGRVQLLFDEGVKLNTEDFPACSAQERQQLEGSTTEFAKQTCGNAQVSIDGPANSEAVALINGGLVVRPAVTAFNGPKKNGNPTVILHARTDDLNNTTVLDGELKQQGNRTLLDVQGIPPLAGGLGSLTDFFATLYKEATDKQAIQKAKKQLKKAKKQLKKAKKKLKKAKKQGNKKKIKKAKKKVKKAKKKVKKAKKKLKRAKRKKLSYIKAKCTGGSYQTTGTWSMGQYLDNNDLNSFQENFEIKGTDNAQCTNGNNTAPFDSGR